MPRFRCLHREGRCFCLEGGAKPLSTQPGVGLWSHLWNGAEQELTLEDAGPVQREWCHRGAAHCCGGCRVASLLVSSVACANAPEVLPALGVDNSTPPLPASFWSLALAPDSALQPTSVCFWLYPV